MFGEARLAFAVSQRPASQPLHPNRPALRSPPKARVGIAVVRGKPEPEPNASKPDFATGAHFPCDSAQLQMEFERGLLRLWIRPDSGIRFFLRAICELVPGDWARVEFE